MQIWIANRVVLLIFRTHLTFIKWLLIFTVLHQRGIRNPKYIRNNSILIEKHYFVLTKATILNNKINNNNINQFVDILREQL